MEKNMKFLEVLFPQNIKCIFCGKEDNNFGICDDCYAKIHFIKGKICKKCGINIKSGEVCIDCKGANYAFERVFCICEYSDIIQYAILKLKKGSKYMAYPLAELVSDYINQLNIPYDFIVPMPIHPNRLKERGFNQSQLLLSQTKNQKKVRNDIIVRSKDTPHQTGLNRDNRKTNLDGAFKVINKKDIKDKIVLIFDDIYTTGSSMQECAKTLIDSGAKQVFGLCLARTPIRTNKYLGEDDIAYTEFIDTHAI